MKIVKPAKLPILYRIVEICRVPHMHLCGVLAFPLARPRALCDELTFWQATAAVLGEKGVVDEGFAKSRGELLVCGSFFAPGGKAVTASFVRARVGRIEKRLAVVGNRYWQSEVPTASEPFTTMRIDWAHAFGGAGEGRNPYGKGAAATPGMPWRRGHRQHDLDALRHEPQARPRSRARNGASLRVLRQWPRLRRRVLRRERRIPASVLTIDPGFAS